MKIKQILTNKDINSFVKIEKIELFVSFIGLNQSGCSTELLYSHSDIYPSNDGKYNAICNMRLDDDDDIKNLDVTEIEIYVELIGLVHPEFAKITLDSHLNIDQKRYVDIMCTVFENKIKEVFCRTLGEHVSVRLMRIKRYRGMFQDRDIYSKLKFEAALDYSKKILKFL